VGHDSSGERRLPAWSVRQLAERIFAPFTQNNPEVFAAGCRELQAGSLCSPELCMSATIIRNGRVIDPANNRNEIVDLAIVDGRVVERPEVRGRRSD